MGIEYSKNQFACGIFDGVIHNEAWKVHDYLIYYRDMIFLVLGSELKKRILEAAHNAPVVGHPSFLKTY